MNAHTQGSIKRSQCLRTNRVVSKVAPSIISRLGGLRGLHNSQEQ